MNSAPDNLVLMCSHERKVLEALRALTPLPHVLAAAAEAVDSSHAVGRQAAQAQHRSIELVDEAVRLTARAQRLLVEARALHDGQMPGT